MFSSLYLIAPRLSLARALSVTAFAAFVSSTGVARADLLTTSFADAALLKRAAATVSAPTTDSEYRAAMRESFTPNDP